MTSKEATRRNAGDAGLVASWLISAGRDRRPGSPLKAPPCNLVLGGTNDPAEYFIGML